MELSTIEKTLIIKKDQQTIPKKERDTSSFYHSKDDVIIKNLIEEAGEEVYNYLKRFGFIYNTNIILLSSIRHYLYGTKEIRQVKTVVNLKLMNQITYNEDCLHVINRFLPIGGSFVGCLIDFAGNKAKKISENNHDSKSEMVFLNSYASKMYDVAPFFMWVYKMFNIRGMRFLTIPKAESILEKNGFQVINKNEINGITFLISVKISNVKSSRLESFNFFNNRYGSQAAQSNGEIQMNHKLLVKD